MIVLRPAYKSQGQAVANCARCRVAVGNPSLAAHTGAPAAWHLTTAAPDFKPIADFYGVKQPVAAKVARMIATVLDRPLALLDNAGLEAELKRHPRHSILSSLVAANPTRTVPRFRAHGVRPGLMHGGPGIGAGRAPGSSVAIAIGRTTATATATASPTVHSPTSTSTSTEAQTSTDTDTSTSTDTRSPSSTRTSTNRRRAKKRPLALLDNAGLEGELKRHPRHPILSSMVAANSRRAGVSTRRRPKSNRPARTQGGLLQRAKRKLVNGVGVGHGAGHRLENLGGRRTAGAAGAAALARNPRGRNNPLDMASMIVGSIAGNIVGQMGGNARGKLLERERLLKRARARKAAAAAAKRRNPERKIAGPFPEIVRRAIVHTVTDIGQFSRDAAGKAAKRDLERYLRAGYLEKGKGGPFPALKTVYARPGFDFHGHRQWLIDQMVEAGPSTIGPLRANPKGRKSARSRAHSGPGTSRSTVHARRAGSRSHAKKRPLASNPKGRDTSRHAQAAETFRMWQDRDVQARATVIEGPPGSPSVAVKLGDVTRINYKSDKYTGRTTEYTHKFGRPLPVLVTDTGARHLYLIGGDVEITKDGLVN